MLASVTPAIHDKTRGAGLLATDATGLPILDPDAPAGIRSGTMWGWTNALWVSFFYSAAGDSDGVRRLLGEGNYARTVQADGTQSTDLHRARWPPAPWLLGLMLAEAWCSALGRESALPWTA